MAGRQNEVSPAAGAAVAGARGALRRQLPLGECPLVAPRGGPQRRARRPQRGGAPVADGARVSAAAREQIGVLGPRHDSRCRAWLVLSAPCCRHPYTSVDTQNIIIILIVQNIMIKTH